MNKKAIEALIKCGAFGSTGARGRACWEVLEQAQAAGQKAQQDAAIGQGSIFDFGLDEPAGNGAPAFAAPSHAPIPSEEFERGELLAAEKESIGLFISEHPLKELGPALAARADCTLSELDGKRDGDWVTVGGMITQAKRLRTKKGDPMMFATLDDLGASVELVVFGKALTGRRGGARRPTRSCSSAAASTTRIVPRPAIIVQQVDRFEPSRQGGRRRSELAAKPSAPPAPLKLGLDATLVRASALVDLKELLAGFPGECEVVVDLHTSGGRRRLRLGPEFKVAPERRSARGARGAVRGRHRCGQDPAGASEAGTPAPPDRARPGGQPVDYSAVQGPRQLP